MKGVKNLSLVFSRITNPVKVNTQHLLSPVVQFVKANKQLSFLFFLIFIMSVLAYFEYYMASHRDSEVWAVIHSIFF